LIGKRPPKKKKYDAVFSRGSEVCLFLENFQKHRDMASRQKICSIRGDFSKSEAISHQLLNSETDTKESSLPQTPIDKKHEPSAKKLAKKNFSKKNIVLNI
jgi:hypothetical protein